MDRESINKAIIPFVETCRQRDLPLLDHALEEAFPGDITSSYLLHIKAAWIDDMDHSGALDKLIDILWDTVDPLTRQYIFAILIHDKNEQLRQTVLSPTDRPAAPVLLA